MEKKVHLFHKTHYQFDSPTSVSPHLVRLQPTPNCHTEIVDYKVEFSPKGFHLSNQLDVYSNKISRLVFIENINHLAIEVSCEAIIRESNPLDFFVEFEYNDFPFEYSQNHRLDLEPFLAIGDHLKAVLRQKFQSQEKSTVSLIIELNKRLFEMLSYRLRMEPGVQEALETLEKVSGSCRDYAWLLLNIYRSIGIASRFVSGYLIDLHETIPAKDALVLHAWVEVYLPGAGWIGLDPTSGLIVGQHYIPLCATPHYKDAAPVTGKTEKVGVTMAYQSDVKRLAL